MHSIVSDLGDGFKIEPLSESATGKPWFMLAKKLIKLIALDAHAAQR